MTALALQGLSKDYGALRVFQNVNLIVESGERRAIIGPNGAGKTTLFGLISGFVKPSAGRVELFGVDVTGEAPHQRVGRGLGRTFQITDLFRELTVLDNLVLGFVAREGLGLAMFRSVSSYSEIYEKAYSLLAMWGLEEKSSAPVRELGYGEQRQVEMLLALTTEPRLLLLDEPTAGLSPAETKAVTKLVRELPEDITVILIEHDMDVAFELGDRVTVLHAGGILADGSPAEIREDQRVLEVYLGSDSYSENP